MFKVLNTVGYYLCCNCLRSVVTVDSKEVDICCKDMISDLPEALICHILSFLPVEVSALTSVLSKKWQYLFALRPNLEFDDAVIYLNPDGKRDETMFMDFVERVLALQGDYPINKLSLTCRRFIDSLCVSRWISNAMERGVSDLELRLNVNWANTMMRPNVFVSKTLVHLKIETGNGVVIDVEDVFLPKLKTLHLNKVLLQHSDNGFVKLITSCHVLEELVMTNLCWDGYWKRAVSSKTLKRLSLLCESGDNNPYSVSFDTPNLVYLFYYDFVADKYDELNFDSLVEASICLQMTSDQRANVSYEHMVGDATKFLMRIKNVQILYLFANTIEVLTFCCEQIPVFKNLTNLTIKTHKQAGWESLPALLKNCPNLETLIFHGIHHKDTMKCEDVDGCL
ncbi:PREDICTED: putative F-box/LRR-repeat protein At3g49150 [Camelina sativa]|uniref:F-box/LRR-repeat protein At3g49150 n=1 Tax=Camelina sativa TaxID=90675 RepID=A0ABM1RSU2_CAMSA|nr:PREDICTED: putative F-box/LRR-repeat protein At3g49150 [Camelina sativa]